MPSIKARSSRSQLWASLGFIVDSKEVASVQRAGCGHAALYLSVRSNRTLSGRLAISRVAATARIESGGIRRPEFRSLGALAKHPLVHVRRAFHQLNALLFAADQEANRCDVY